MRKYLKDRFYIRGWSVLGLFNTVTACLCNRVLVLHVEPDGAVFDWHIDKGTNFPRREK